ncbi:MAG TPA: hypothetical protein VL354_11220 [Spirochaetia bacterium]|nr:hypothetical protein [Spirochaetia bacterium]
MTRNYLIFFFGVFLLLVFTFVFGFVSIYNENLIAGVLAIIGYIAAIIIALMIGVASREEGGALYVWFFSVAGVTAVLFVWYLSRAGTLLKVW